MANPEAITPASHAEQALGLPPGSYPFRSRWLQHAGAPLHYIDEGRGPALLMLHGNPTWSFLYRHLVRALRGEFRCVVPDLPGFGLSPAPAGFSYRPQAHAQAVQALLAHLDLRDATLVAHDWGGPIGLAAALAEPGRITRLVLGNTWAWPVNGDWHFEWFSRLMGGPIGRWGARRHNLFVNAVMPGAMRRGPLPREVLEAYRAPFRRSGDLEGTHVFPACITESRAFLHDVFDGLGAFNGEDVLIVWPDRDIAFRPQELARWREVWPDAAVHEVARCGHFLWEEAGAEAAAAIARWAKGRGAGLHDAHRQPTEHGSAR